MALSDDDKTFLLEIRKEDREHLRESLREIREDSRMQWKSIARQDKELSMTKKELADHKEASAGVHSQPCATAAAAVKAHEEESPVHNPKKTLAILGTLAIIGGAIGSGLTWVANKLNLFKVSPAIFIALALVGGGCTKADRVYEEDRVVLEMTRQIVAKQATEIEKLESEINAHSYDASVLAKLLPIASNLKQLNADAIANVAVMQDNWGAPGAAKIEYSPAAAEDARKAAKNAHSGKTFWACLGLSVLATAGTIIGILRSPAARLVPWVGPIVAAFDPLLKGAEQFMAEQKAKGNLAAAAGLAESLLTAQKDANVDKVVKKRLAKVKKKIAPALDAIRDLTPAPGAPAPDDETKVIRPT